MLIKHKRLSLKETQTDFGRRFKVSHAAVSVWESGQTQAPYSVIYFVLQDLIDGDAIKCPYCNGTGTL